MTHTLFGLIISAVLCMLLSVALGLLSLRWAVLARVAAWCWYGMKILTVVYAAAVVATWPFVGVEANLEMLPDLFRFVLIPLVLVSALLRPRKVFTPPSVRP